MNHDHRNEPDRDSKMNVKSKWVFIGFLLIAGYFLFPEHRAPLSGWLSSYGIWLLLLACPLLHIFMHGGHGSHGNHSAHQNRPSDNDTRHDSRGDGANK